MKKLVLVILCLVLGIGCTTTAQKGPDAAHGLDSAFRGIAHLVLSPFQIAAGLLEGISAMPYYLSTNLHEINKGMIDAQAKITLDDTYDSAYGKRLTHVPESGDTGEVFRRMKHATRYFQKVLKKYGVHDWEDYILTSIDTANSEGYTLFAVVYRPHDAINVTDKYNPRVRRLFSKEDRLFYEPFERDVNGRALDTVVDWAGIPRAYVKTQKSQAILITLAANAVLEGKQGTDYWDIERRWMAGDFRQITEERMGAVRDRMGI